MSVAIILAGGRSSRLGQPKEEAIVGSTTLLKRTLAACESADSVVVVGPFRESVARADALQVQESPPHGGPVAALAAAVAVIDVTADDALVLACDMPDVAEVVAALPASVPDGAGAVIARDHGRLQPLAGRYRLGPLRDALGSAPAEGRAMHALLEQLEVHVVDVPDRLTADVDTRDDLAAARAGATVAGVMLTAPTTLPASADVGAVRRFFGTAHVHLALLTDSDRLITAIARDDLTGLPDEAPARTCGHLVDRCVAPDAPLHEVLEAMRRDGVRRLAVVDAATRLLGLLCLNRRADGFCSDDDVRARRLDRTLISTDEQTSQA